MKPIRLTKHAREQALERGTDEQEIQEAIRKSSREPAKKNRTFCRFNFSFGRHWNGKFYAIKQVAPVVQESANEIIVITVYTFTFRTMKISYDPEIDALYIRLLDGQRECRTVRLNVEIALNMGEDEQLVGIEILDAKEILGHAKLPQIVLENVSLASAA